MRLRPEKAELFARFLQACCRPGAVLEVYEGKTYLVAWVAGREEDWKLWIYRDGRGWKEARLLHINFLGGRTWWNIPPEPGEAEPPPWFYLKREASSPSPEAWERFLEALRPTLRALMREARPEVQGDTLLLCFPEHKAFHFRKAREQEKLLLPLARAHFGVERVEAVLERRRDAGLLYPRMDGDGSGGLRR